MKSLGRILCAIDLEKASEPAFERALSLAVVAEAKLFLLHATPSNVPFSRRARERLDYLTELRERAEAAGVDVRVDEQHGDPAGLIALHARSRKADLVVLGSNRRRGWRRLREGSVAERVLRRAAWPVLIVPWDSPRTGVLAKRRVRDERRDTKSRTSGG
ncbi:MAG TPA: universal stress protein [Vicinamibacterales bacterium]|jgi:nucleotide-binding universal stress UspA family protein|nr:universal stress protein [Vicinamibacterales bacterium]